MNIHRNLRTVLSTGAVLVLCACAVSPEPFTDAEKRERISADRAMMFGNPEPVSGPVGLEEAMARAVKYNLDHRVELLNDVVTGNQLALAHYDMLPKLAASAGFTERNNDAASTSTTVLSHINSSEPAISSERRVQNAQLQLSWNVLDFGVSYIRAKQMADKALMADEQRRKVVQNIIQDVRYAYWRAVAAERLLARLGPLTRRTEAALADARRLENTKVREPLPDLQYQRALLSTLERLKSLRRDLVAAKAQLAALMSLPPGGDYTLKMPRDERDTPVPRLTAKVRDMEEVALANRPELAQAAYQVRISRSEADRILLEMLPGINLGLSGNFDSNKYTVNHAWMTQGVSFAWNLLTLASTPERLEVAASDQKMLEMKRAALSMAVVAQVNVAAMRFTQAEDEYATAKDQADVERRIFKQMNNAGLAAQIGELAVIQAEADDVFATLRRDSAYANLQNAYGAILVSVGADPMPDAVTDHTLPTLAQAINKNLAGWSDGSALTRILATLKPPPNPAEPAKTAGAPAKEPAGEPMKTVAVPKKPVKPVKTAKAAGTQKQVAAAAVVRPAEPRSPSPAAALAQLIAPPPPVGTTAGAAATAEDAPLFDRIAAFLVEGVESGRAIPHGHDPMHHG